MYMCADFHRHTDSFRLIGPHDPTGAKSWWTTPTDERPACVYVYVYV